MLWQSTNVRLSIASRATPCAIYRTWRRDGQSALELCGKWLQKWVEHLVECWRWKKSSAQNRFWIKLIVFILAHHTHTHKYTLNFLSFSMNVILFTFMVHAYLKIIFFLWSESAPIRLSSVRSLVLRETVYISLVSNVENRQCSFEDTYASIPPNMDRTALSVCFEVLPNTTRVPPNVLERPKRAIL